MTAGLPLRKRAIHRPARRPRQPVVDGFAEIVTRDRHHRDGFRTRGVEHAQMREQIGRRLGEIAALGRLKDPQRAAGAGGEFRAERQQCLAGLHLPGSSRSGVRGA